MHWNQRWARTSCWEVKHTRALASCFLSAKTWRKIKHGPTCFFRVNLLPRTTKLHHSAVQHQHAGGENMCLDWNWSGNPPRHVETLWTPHSSLCTRPLPLLSSGPSWAVRSTQTSPSDTFSWCCILTFVQLYVGTSERSCLLVMTQTQLHIVQASHGKYLPLSWLWTLKLSCEQNTMRW